MEKKTSCPSCGSNYTYAKALVFHCRKCGYEWPRKESK